MLKHKLMLLGTTITMLILVSLLHCTLPTNPGDPANTSVNIVIQSSKWKTDNNMVEDTAGMVIKIGAALKLPENIDSINFNIVFGGAVVFDTMLRDFQPIFRDTLWKEFVFYTDGPRLVTLTPFSKLGLSPVFATVKIIGKQFPVNHVPSLTVDGISIIKPTETCTLTLKASDVDSGQILSLFMSGNPPGSLLQKDNTQFIWTAPADFIGKQTVTFTVTDNGIPPQSSFVLDTITVYAG